MANQLTRLACYCLFFLKKVTKVPTPRVSYNKEVVDINVVIELNTIYTLLYIVFGQIEKGEKPDLETFLEGLKKSYFVLEELNKSDKKEMKNVRQ